MSLKGIVKGLLIGVLLTTLFLFLLSVVSYFSQIPQEYLNIAMYLCTAVSVFTGAIICTRISGAKLLLNGLAYAIFYILLLIAVSVIKNGTIAVNMRFFALCAGVILSSLVGVIVTNRNFL